MTFLEALNWMSESEKNIAIAPNGLKYLIKDGALNWLSEHQNEIRMAGATYSKLNEGGWMKSEPALEEVEVVTFQNVINGRIGFAVFGSEDYKAYEKANECRKVKVKFK